MKTLKLFAVILVALLFSQCKYDFIVPEEVIDPTDPTVEDISFATEILPIFTSKCASCHDGSPQPDLTEANAYNSLTSTSRYINADSPEESLIYTKSLPSGSHTKYSEAEAALVLTWITQGAQNN